MTATFTRPIAPAISVTPPALRSHRTTSHQQGELSKTLELVDESSRRSSDPDKVMACEVWGDGVVALLSSGRVKAVSGIHGAEPRWANVLLYQ